MPYVEPLSQTQPAAPVEHEQVPYMAPNMQQQTENGVEQVAYVEQLAATQVVTQEVENVAPLHFNSVTEAPCSKKDEWVLRKPHKQTTTGQTPPRKVQRQDDVEVSDEGFDDAETPVAVQIVS